MTYTEIAARYGLVLCQECNLNVHSQGFVGQFIDTIHWRERRMTKSGLRRFLMLVAEARLRRARSGPNQWRPGEWLWILNVLAYRMALELHVKLPRTLSEADRARVRYLTQGRSHSPEGRWARSH